MNRKLGDKVNIKTDLIVGEYYNDEIDFVTEMIEYKGRQATILKIDDGYYKLDVDNKEWNWAEDMLEDVINYNWIFSLEKYKNENIVINCESEEESIKLFKVLMSNGITKWLDNTDLNKNNTEYGEYEDKICYNVNLKNKVSFCDINYYTQQNYKIYKFSEIDFSQVLNKESINNIALNNFNITNQKSITLDDLLNSRGFKTGDVISDIDNLGIVYGNKVIYITAECTEIINPKAYCEIIPVELIESNINIQKALSEYLYDADYELLEQYFIKIKEPPKLKTICSIKFTSNSNTTKDFILESNISDIKVDDIIECCTGSAYQYGRVTNIIEKELTKQEINTYRICRKLSL